MRIDPGGGRGGGGVGAARGMPGMGKVRLKKGETARACEGPCGYKYRAPISAVRI